MTARRTVMAGSSAGMRLIRTGGNGLPRNTAMRSTWRLQRFLADPTPKGEQAVTGLWVFVYVTTLVAPDVRITSGLTTLQCAMLIETLDALRSQNVAGNWWCISPEGQQFITAKEMGIKAPILRNQTK
jgi:hypothetical protein